MTEPTEPTDAIAPADLGETGDAAPACSPSTPVSTGTSGEWEHRALCPDESCIGVLGADGRCRICGRRGDVSHAPRPSPHNAVVPAVLPNDNDDRGIAATSSAVSSGAAAPSSDHEHDRDEDDLSRRELCPDDACIGVLGPDGACKVCGKRR